MTGIDADFYFDYDKVMPAVYGAVAAARAARTAAETAAFQGAEQVANIMAQRHEWQKYQPSDPLPDALRVGMPEDAWWAIEDAHKVAEEAWQQVAAVCEPLRETSRRAWEASKGAWQAVQGAEDLVAWPLRVTEGVVWASVESNVQWRTVIDAAASAEKAWDAVYQGAMKLVTLMHESSPLPGRTEQGAAADRPRE